jgi:LCP family protein required for cell wall assembly
MQSTTPTATADPITTAPVTAAAATDALAVATVADSATDAAAQPATAVTPDTASASADNAPPLEKTLNILILGSDRRPNNTNWRTDVMMIAALDFDHGRAGVVSIPRDLYLEVIPGHQPNRMNVVDYLGEQTAENGGPALLSQIIEEKMGIRIDHFLRFDFNSFKEVVDALGGVDVPVDCRYAADFFLQDLSKSVQPGLIHMTGSDALAYVRSRRLGGDLDRARRQQRLIWAMRQQVLEDNLLTSVPALYQALDDSIQTDIGIVNTLRIVRFAVELGEDDVHGLVIAPPTMLTSSWRAGMSVFVPDWAAIRAATQTVFESAPFVETNTPTNCP